MAEEVDFKNEQKKKTVYSIEKSMAGGVNAIVEALIGCNKLSKKEIREYVLLGEDPYLHDEIMHEIQLRRHEGGWLSKILLKAWNPFTKAFQTIYYNKRVQKALNKSNNKKW